MWVDESFKEHPKCLNGASDLINEAFQDKGRHTRMIYTNPVMPLGLHLARRPLRGDLRWTARKAELDRALGPGHGMVGQRLLSETDAVRVWRIELAPGERVAFHTHVLNYFWTALSPGRSRSHDGRRPGGRDGLRDRHHQALHLRARARRWCMTSRTSGTRRWPSPRWN